MFEYIEEYWSKSFFEFIKERLKTPDRSSYGRRPLNHEQIFIETLAQFEKGDIQHLDDGIDDPIYL